MKSFLLLAAAAVAVPATAAPPVQTFVSVTGSASPTGAVPVELIFLNTGTAVTDYRPPQRVAAELAVGAVRTAVTLDRIGDDGKPLSIAPGSFGRAAYMLTGLPVQGATAATGILTIALLGTGGTAIALPVMPDAALAATAVATTPPDGAPAAVVVQTLNSPDADSGNGFLANLSAYEPIYGVFGPGTDTSARLQISLKYQPFGRGGAFGGSKSWLDGIHVAFTQRLFWDLGSKSSPFRNVDYVPEAFYLLPARHVTSRIALGGQGGFRHESNGRDGIDSRSFNTVYAQPVATVPVGSWKLTLGPRLLAYIGDLSDNPDIRRYRGNTGLLAEIGSDDGFRLTTTSRYNFGSGKGAIDALVSYPLNRIARSLNLYVFGQGFAGYGENLLDYNRKATRLRVGFGIVR